MSSCPLNFNSSFLSSYLLSFSKTVFLHLFLGSIFMSLIQTFDMYQTQLRSTQFTSKMCFVKRLTNYIENMTITSNITHLQIANTCTNVFTFISTFYIAISEEIGLLFRHVFHCYKSTTS